MATTLYGAHGTLSYPLSKTANTIQVDGDLTSYLQTQLPTGWAYLSITNGKHMEVVRLTVGRDNKLYIVRGQDHTIPCSFGAGSEVKYVLTTAEIKEAATPITLNLYGDEAIVVEDGVVSYNVPNITGLGGISAYVSGANTVLDDNVGLFGCCNANSPGAPPVPPPYTYFTTQLYPLEAIDYAQVQEQYKKDLEQGQSISPIPMDIWLLEQPVYIEKNWVIASLQMTDFLSYGGSKQYAYTEPDTIIASLEFTDFQSYGGSKQYSYIDSNMVKADLLFVSILTYGNAIEYTYIEENMVTASLSAPTITVSDS